MLFFFEVRLHKKRALETEGRVIVKRQKCAALNPGEQFAIAFWAKHGFQAVRFRKAEMRKRKTPDFRIFKEDRFILYCEAKHVQYDNWLDKQLATAKPLELVGGLRRDPVFNRLSGHIHLAAQQFDAVNQEREFPNVLVFTNSDKLCGFPDLVGVLTGSFYAENGAVEPIYRNISEGRIREEKLIIDLYVWFNEWKGNQQRGSLFFNRGSKHYSALCALLGSDPSRHRRV